MPFLLEDVVPWGRSFKEYTRMFNLSSGDLAGRILGSCDGPASFNVEANMQGYDVISCDPVYRFSAKDIQLRINQTYHNIVGQLHENQDDYTWDTFISSEDLGKARVKTMQKFLVDYSNADHRKGRYIAASLPTLPFPDKIFDLALCGHFLFLYSDNFSLDFHLQSVLELCRVANEVRIFPLLDLNRRKSCHLVKVKHEIQKKGYAVDFVQVPYEFMKGANVMMQVLCR